MTGSVSWRREGAVAVLAFDNPGRLNAIDFAIADGLVSAVGEIARDDRVGALLLRGAGLRAFSAGIDLKHADETGDRRAAFAAIDARIDALGAALDALDVPVLCMMGDVCYGGAVMLASFADLRIASHDLRFSMPALDNGLFYPVPGLSRLTGIMGLQRVRSLFLRGEPIPADELLGWGLLDKVVAGEELEATALAFATRLAARPRRVTAAYRAIFAALERGEPDEATRLRADALAARSNPHTR